MKVFVDTNVILDVLCNRKEFVIDSSKILRLCELRIIDGYISALSIPNIVYIMRKELDSNKIKEILGKLFLTFSVVELNANDIKHAAGMDYTDFEDALQSACAKRIKADYIITRDMKHFTNSQVVAISPSSFLNLKTIIK